jgi:ribonuclease HI
MCKQESHIAAAARNDIVIYVQGAEASSAEAGGWAYLVEMNGAPLRHVKDRIEGSTKSASEIAALIHAARALQWIKDDGVDIADATIRLTSRPLLDGLTMHMDEWKRSRWRDPDGAEIPNAGLWKALRAEINTLARMDVEIRCQFVTDDDDKRAIFVASLARRAAGEFR